MPKRKAEEHRGAKSPRPPPPPYAHDDDDSDFCEIIEPSSRTAVQAPMSIPPQRPTVAPPLAPAPPFDISYQNNSSRGLHAPVDMFPGMSQAVPFVQPVAPADFGFAHMQVPLDNFFQANPLRLRPDVVGDQADFQDGRFFVEDPMPRPFALSSAGEASGSVTAQVRVREGASAEEIKEEPEVLCPTAEELSPVAVLRSHGLNTDEAVRFLRQNGHNLQAAIQQAMDTVFNRRSCQLEDRVRLESEKERDRVAAQRREDEMSLAVVGDIVPRFREQSLLLDEQEGCAAFIQAVHRVSKGQQGWSPALSAFREKAVKLLFLEQKTLRWYSQNLSQVRGYFRQVTKRLESFVENRNAQEKDMEEATGDKSPIEPGTFNEGAHQGQKDCNNHSDAIEETEVLTSCVNSEIEALHKILYMLPTTAGGVPDAFLKCNEHAATLETDGVEELCHESADASRSRRSGERLVIALD